jgi:hypothetical protein
VLRALAKFALTMAVVLGFLWLVAGMSLRVAAALALMAAIFGDIAAPHKFKPFTLEIVPKWHELLSTMPKMRAIAADGDVRDLLSRIRAFSPTAQELIDRGITVTFLKSDLLFVRPGSVFVSRFEFRWTLLHDRQSDRTFQFYFEPRGVERIELRYDLGTIDEAMGETQASRYEQGTNFASLPFAIFWKVIDRYGSTRLWSPKWTRAMSAKLARYGWSMATDGTLEHRFCTIRHVGV